MSLDKFIREALRKESWPSCRVEYFEPLSCTLEPDKKKLMITVRSLKLSGSCKSDRLCIKVGIGARNIVYPLRSWFKRRGIERFLPIEILLEESEVAAREAHISIVEEFTIGKKRVLRELFKPIAVPIKIADASRSGVKSRSTHKHPTIKVPPPCRDHDWVSGEILVNFRGDVVAVLYRCRRCGRTRRELAP